MTPTLLQAADALAEALRPLATAPLGEWADHAPDNTNIEGVSLTLGDLRRARTAMAEYEAEPKGWRTMDSAPKDGAPILAMVPVQMVMTDDLELPIKSLVSQRWEDIPYYRELLDARERRGFLAGIEAAAKVADAQADSDDVTDSNGPIYVAGWQDCADRLATTIRSIEPPVPPESPSKNQLPP